MAELIERHPDNASGPFYVECDCCIACEAPYHEAPDLMGAPYSSENNYGCFFRKQPTTPDEVDRACNAVQVSCVKAVRYAGDDPTILRKLYETGSMDSCDSPRSPSSECEKTVVGYVTRTFASAARHGVNWTFTCAEEPETAIVAACYGAEFGRILGVFAVDKASQAVKLVTDDRSYRPKEYDPYKRPKSRLWGWMLFWRR